MSDTGFSMVPRKRNSDDPRRVGFWKIGRELGSGASGRVRIARHSKTGEYAAIKIISKTKIDPNTPLDHVAGETERLQLAIEREIVVMKLLDHPNVMRLYDVWETSTELYLVLEYIQGGELFEHLCDAGKFPVHKALSYFQQIIFAIAYCHNFNIAHRDLKPENILVDQEDNIKIADFGMAIWQGGDDAMLRTSCGSPHYAAPEIISGMPYNGSAADIWSCGTILFALLTGKLPFDNDNFGELCMLVRTEEPEIPADMDPLAQDLIRQMLHKDATERITMPDIITHPFFTMFPAKQDAPSPRIIRSAQPIDMASSIDPDIFANLRTLWHGTPDNEIVESLTNDEATLQKGIYHLLVQYRENHTGVPRDNEETIAQYRLERKKSKKAKTTAAALKNAIQELELSSLGSDRSSRSLPRRNDPPTPRRASRRNRSSILSDGSISNAVAPIIQLEAPSPVVSPTPAAWDPLPPLTVPEIQDDKMQAFFQQIVQHLNVLQAKATSEHGVWSPNLGFLSGVADGNDPHATTTPPPTPAYETLGKVTPEITGIGLLGGTRPLSVRRKARRPLSSVNVDTSNKENMGDDHLTTDGGGNITKRLSLKKGKGRRAGLGEKRVHIVEPTIKERSKLVKKNRLSVSPALSDSSTFSASSPTPFSLPPFSSSPKRTWLGNVFNLRSTSISLLSSSDVQTTRNECRRLLMAMNIRVVLEDPEGLGVLKCRLDEVKEPSGVMNVLKAVKFKVVFQRPHICGYAGDEVLMMSLTVIHEKGSAETFKEVCKRLEQEWTLDKTDVMSPVIVDSGRFYGVYSYA